MKKIVRFYSVLLVFIMMFVFFGCGIGNKKYRYTHDAGNVSVFALDFNSLTGTYEGYPINVVLRNGKNYQKVSGATQKCSGILIQNKDENFSNWYTFETDNWSVQIIVDNDNKIRCSIGGRSYIFMA